MSRRRAAAYAHVDVAQIAHDAAQVDEDAEPCPGDCNRVWVAAERAVFDEAKKTRPRAELLHHDVPMVPAAPMWCRPCQDTIITAIAGFPAQCEPLTPGPLNIPRDSAGGRSANINPPSPSPAWDQADEVIRWAVNTEDRLRAHIGDGGFGQRPVRTLGAAVAYLTSHASALLSCPDAHSIGFDALRLSRRLTQVTGTDKLVHRLPGECLVCDRCGTLQREDGDDMVQCRACGACWDFERFNFLAKAYAEARTA